MSSNALSTEARAPSWLVTSELCWPLGTIRVLNGAETHKDHEEVVQRAFGPLLPLRKHC